VGASSPKAGLHWSETNGGTHLYTMVWRVIHKPVIIKEGSYFVLFVTLKSSKPWCTSLGAIRKFLMSSGALSWICNL
jgi:hypothetical protein